MTLDPISISRIHNSLTCGSNSDWFTEITVSGFSNPSNFWGKALNMILFDLKWLLWDKHWEIGIFNAICFDQFIEINLNFFPDGVSPWTKNVASRNIIVIDKPWFYNNFLIPSREVLTLFSFNSQKITFLFWFFLFLFLTFFLFLTSFFIFLFNFFELLKQIKSFECNLIVGKELEEIFTSNLNSSGVIHRMESPTFKVE